MKELTILMPCLNEAETIGSCVGRAKKLLADNGIDGEVLVSDNGSSDGSRQLAESAGARVVRCPVRGYGAALMFGIDHAEGDYILMGDSDESYHFDEALPLIERLREGFDLCMGTRLKGRIERGAMPRLNRAVGNPALTAIGKLFFKIPLSDFHCGMRAFRRDRIRDLDLVTTGMEWASEMIVKARLAGWKMTEVPITLYRAGRSRSPHLRPWRDGWRHLRFMLLHSPFWLFIIPGLIMAAAGIAGQALLMPGMLAIGRVNFDVHTMTAMAFLLVVGIQVVFTGLFAQLYSRLAGILPYDERFEKITKRFTLEKLLIACIALGLLGFGGFLYTLRQWYLVNFSALNYQVTMRQLIPSLSLIAVSVQGVFNGFMMSVLFLRTKRARAPEF